MRVKNTSARMHRDTVAWLALHLEGGHQVNRAALWHLLLLLDLLALLLLLWLWLYLDSNANRAVDHGLPFGLRSLTLDWLGRWVC